MICTVTSFTLSEVIAGLHTFGMIAVIGLICLLVVKELSAVTEEPRLVLLSRYLNAGTVPLLIVFFFIVITVLY